MLLDAGIGREGRFGATAESAHAYTPGIAALAPQPVAPRRRAAIARELTRAMGGELTLTRTGAEGSTFKIVLPAG